MFPNGPIKRLILQRTETVGWNKRSAVPAVPVGWLLETANPCWWLQATTLPTELSESRR